jgi:ferredoxin
MNETRVIDLGGLQALIDALSARGYTVLGPTLRTGSIVNAPIASIDDLPRGWGDEQDAAHYRLRRRDDDALFGFASGAQSAKPVLFPADELLWRSRRSDSSVTVESPEPGTTPTTTGTGPYALLGIRSCDLRAVAIHDQVLTSRQFADANYAARRSEAFIVAVACSDPGGTCFCVSMGTGPSPTTREDAAFDLALTEILDEAGHRFVVDVGSERGAEVLAEAGALEAAESDLAAAAAVVEQAVGRMGRTLDTEGLRDVLYASVESPHWEDVASRCLACTNCTMVCPTCFCTSVEDVTDLDGRSAERHRVWDSCFSASFSYIHGGTVRDSTKSRYRQWITHKLASWVDQFGSSGCVGCGRCITWCPAAIDITAEAAALRASLPSKTSTTSARSTR